MATTVQKQLLKLALIISPTTKKGFKFNDSSAALNISNATNATPIVVTTTTNHGYVDNQQVYITAVGGNTAANNTAANPNWTITRISATQFSLNGSSGNGAYTSGGTVTAELIGTVDAANITRQRLLDIYNEARKVLFNTIYQSVGSQKLQEYIYGTFKSTTITISAYSDPYKTIVKPSDFIRLVSMTDNASPKVPIVVLPNTLLQEAKRGTHPYYTVSATNLIAFEVKVSGNDCWAIPGNAGTTPAHVDYYGITDWVIFNDVVGGSVTEIFSPDVEYAINEIAQAIYQEMNEDQLNALAQQLIRKVQ